MPDQVFIEYNGTWGMDTILSAFTCVEFSYPVLRSHTISPEGRISMKWPEYGPCRSQDLEKFYHDAGQFYFATMDAYRTTGFWGPNTYPIILSELEVQDLDTPTDWALAEIKFKLIDA